MAATNPQINESDSEIDADYFPPNADEGSPSSSEDERESKRARAESPKVSAEEEEARKASLWANFQALVKESTSTRTPEPQKMIKIQKRYLFAGEEITEVVEVPEDSPDAKRWPVWRPQGETSQSASASSSAVEPTTTAESTASSTPALAPTPSTGKRPGPRKPKTQLAELPGRGAAKAKKLTTLDKSVMDWKAHVQTSEDIGLKDELEANRRGGGYLEKVDFLKRVEERKDAVFEAAKGSKRRRE